MQANNTIAFVSLYVTSLFIHLVIYCNNITAWFVASISYKAIDSSAIYLLINSYSFIVFHFKAVGVSFHCLLLSLLVNYFN